MPFCLTNWKDIFRWSSVTDCTVRCGLAGEWGHTFSHALLNICRFTSNIELCVAENIPDALQTECIKCSEVQKKQAGHVMSFIQLNHPDMWEAILNKFDPEGTFRKKYGVDDDEEEEQEDR